MRKNPLPLLAFFMVLLISIVTCSFDVQAGEAGVGVINVPPKYGYIRVEDPSLPQYFRL
jgi:hypothetical protein